MFDSIIKNSLRHKVMVVSIAALLLAYGFYFIQKLNVDIFPDLNRPTVNIMTETSGMAPEEVELLVTTPIEIALQGLSGIKKTRSSSAVGLSVVYAEFNWGEDIYKVRQLVSEKLNQVSETLPKGITPTIGPISSIMGEIQLIGLISKTKEMTPEKLRYFADYVLKPRIQSIEGVSQVISIGGGIKQHQISISSQKIQEKRISLEDLEHNLTHLSQNTTGGFVNLNTKEYLIRNLGALTSAEDIANSVVGIHLGKAVEVKDIATISESIKVKRGDASVNGEAAVILSIQKQPQADTITVTKRIENVLKEINNKDIEIKPNLFKQATFIQIAIHNVVEALRDGSIMVFLVLIFFLANFRATIISMTAIPISFVLTFLVLRYFGIGVNTMTLGGLAIAIGELVDDAIVDVENILRRLREQKPDEKNYLKCIFEASKEIRSSIVIATFTVIIVFIPLFQIEGIEGRFFIPLGIAYVISIVASLMVSVSVTPALSAILFKNASTKQLKEPKVTALLKKIDSFILNKTIHYPKILLFLFTIVFVYSLKLFIGFQKDFLPAFNETTATINLLAVPGISLEESNKLGTQAEKLILLTKGVVSVSRRTGRAELDEHAEGVHYSEIDVDFSEDIIDKTATLNEIREKLSSISGTSVNIGQPISHRIDHLLSGVRAQLAIKVFGNDLNILRSKSAEIYHAIKDTKGLVDLQVEQQTLIPQIKIEVQRDIATKYGIVVGDLTSLLEMALRGAVVANIIENKRPVDVFMVFDEKSKSNLEELKKIVVKIMPDGEKILLGKVAEVYESTGVNAIQHENAQRKMVVQANITERGLEEVVSEIKQKIQDKVKLPENYNIEYGGQYQSQQSAFKKIMVLAVLSILVVFVLLWSNFKSVQITLQILFNIPLAMVGSIFAIHLTTKSINVATLVAMVTLVGIASRNGIMMISHYIHLMKYENMKFNKETIIKGSLERLIPVLMTTLSAALALIPIALSKNVPGKEILHPVAIVILGGLISSTLLDMILTPAIFLKYGQKASENIINNKEGDL